MRCYLLSWGNLAMKNCTFKIGIAIEIDGQIFVIVRLLDDGSAQLERQRDGLLSITTVEKLLEQYVKRQLTFANQNSQFSSEGQKDLQLGRPLSTFPESIQERTIRKKKYLDYVLQMGSFVSSPKILKP